MTGRLIRIYCINKDAYYDYPVGTSLDDIAEDINPGTKYPVLGAIVNNKLKELTYEIYKPKHVYFIDITNTDGMRMYLRSIIFVLFKALREIMPKAEFKVENPVSNGIYCTVKRGKTVLTPAEISMLKDKMQDIIQQNIPFQREEIPTDKAIEIFEEQGLHHKTALLKTRGNVFTSVYHLGNSSDYFYGFLVPSTGYLKVFDLVPYHDGMLLRYPERKSPEKTRPMVKQEKMLQIFNEFNRWGKILRVNNIGDLNHCASNHRISELIKISEALHEKKVAQIADEIRAHRDKLKLILIAGPSSSGKTTFAKRLAIQLKVNGMNPVKLSLDNYFVNREINPKDADGNYDFEALEAIDIELFNNDLHSLMEGKEITLPRFSFETGERFYNGDKMKICKRDIIIVEGIHGLNPQLTPHILAENKYKIYVSALTTISIDGHNLIPTTDNRLARRIIRDHKYRNYSALETIKRWDSVRRGEELRIFPFQEEADIMFNSALLYELGVLKRYAEPLLNEVQPNVPEYAEANRLLKFFSYFVPIQDHEIPPTSIMREFIGGSTFNYDE